MRRRPLLWFLMVLLPLAGLMAQPDAKSSKRNADLYFDRGRYDMALSFYQRYAEQFPEDVFVQERLGICFYHQNQTDRARQYLQPLAERVKNPVPEAVYFLARSFHAESRFAEAASFYKAYLRLIATDHPRRRAVKDDLWRCSNGMRMQGQRSNVLVENLGEQINTAGDEYKPIISPNNPDRLYFSSARENVVGGRRSADGREDPDYGQYHADIFYSNSQNGVWGVAATLSFLLSSPRHDVLLDFTNAGRHLYFFRGNTLHSGEILVDTFKPTATRDQNFGVFEGPMRPWEGDCEPHFVNDSTLVFASRRAGGFGGLDLYVSVLKGTEWTEPENLGPTVNTAYDETSPFLALDGRTLYFSSNRADASIGGFDVFKAIYNDLTETWTQPVNLGLPVNSGNDDKHYRISHDGMRAFFASDRKTGFGGWDTYAIYFREYQQEMGKLSEPVLFTQVPEYKQRKGIEPGGSGASDPATTNVVRIDPIYYEENGFALTPRNIRSLQEVSSLLKTYPRLSVLLTSHSDGSDPADFDHFFAIKRAEEVGEYLSSQGVDAARIFLRSAGSAYPAASVSAGGTPNPAARRLNRRIDIQLLDGASVPVRLEVNEPPINEQIALPDLALFRKRTQGLAYKVQITASRQMYNSPMMRTYTDLMIEKDGSSEFYKYTLGLYNVFQSADQLRRELQRDFPDAFIVAYIDGKRISKSEAKQYIERFPDLAGFIER